MFPLPNNYARPTSTQSNETRAGKNYEYKKSMVEPAPHLIVSLGFFSGDPVYSECSACSNGRPSDIIEKEKNMVR